MKEKEQILFSIKQNTLLLAYIIYTNGIQMAYSAEPRYRQTVYTLVEIPYYRTYNV